MGQNRLDKMAVWLALALAEMVVTVFRRLLLVRQQRAVAVVVVEQERVVEQPIQGVRAVWVAVVMVVLNWVVGQEQTEAPILAAAVAVTTVSVGLQAQAAPA